MTAEPRRRFGALGRAGNRKLDRLHRGAAGFLLLSLVMPALFPFVAGFAHAAYHRVNDRIAEVHVEGQRLQRMKWAQEMVLYSHSHGPGGEVHTHIIPIDLALQVVENGETEESDEIPVWTDQRIDKHVPPAMFQPVTGITFVRLLPSSACLPGDPHRASPHPPPWI